MNTTTRKQYAIGGNSGYVGYSKSVRATEAEENGLKNKSQINKAFAEEINAIIVKEGKEKVTISTIKKALANIVADEWHHTSKFGNKTKYYSVANVAKYFLDDKKQKKSNNHKLFLEALETAKIFAEKNIFPLGYSYTTIDKAPEELKKEYYRLSKIAENLSK